MKKATSFLCFCLIFAFFWGCGKNPSGSDDVVVEVDSLIIFTKMTPTTEGMLVDFMYSRDIYDGWQDPARIGPNWENGDTIVLDTNDVVVINGTEYLKDRFIAILGPSHWGLLPSFSNGVWADTNIIKHSPVYHDGIFCFIRKGWELWSWDEKTLLFKGDSTSTDPYYGIIVDSLVSWDRTETEFTLWIRGTGSFLTMTANVLPRTFTSPIDPKINRAKFVFTVSSILNDTRAKLLIFNFPGDQGSVLYMIQEGACWIVIPIIMTQNINIGF